MVRRSHDAQKVQIVVVCLERPTGLAEQPTEFGLQDQHGVVLQGEALRGGALQFVSEAECTIMGDMVEWRGPYIHGKRGERFMYVGWRTIGATGWIRRWKIMLGDLRAPDLAAVAHSVHRVIVEVPEMPSSRVRVAGNWRLE